MAAYSCILGGLVGQGTYGQVFADVKDDYVTKVMKPGYETSRASAEVDILFRLHSPHLLQGINLWEAGECGPGTGFSIRLPRLTGLVASIALVADVDALKRLLFGLALGLRCLHSNNYLHLDISANNCMYSGSLVRSTSPYRGVLIDFGLAVGTQRDLKSNLKPIKTKQLRISPGYRDPTGFKPGADGNYTYSDKSDIWALGMLFLQMFNGGQFPIDYQAPGAAKLPGTNQPDFDIETRNFIQRVLDHKNAAQNLAEILRNRLPQNILADLIPLLSGMLDITPSSRLDIEQVISHPFFGGLASEICTTISPAIPDLRLAIPMQSSRLAALNSMIQILSREWKMATVELLFVAVDVYYRFMAVTPDDSELELIIGAVVIIAHSIFYHYLDLNFKEYRDPKFRKYQFPILKALGGIIRRSYLYTPERTLDQLVYLFNYAVPRSITQANQYLYLDVPMILKSQPSSRFGVQDSEMNIGTLLAQHSSLESKSLESRVSQVYTYLVQTLVTRFGNNHTAVFVMAIDIYINYCKLVVLNPWRTQIETISGLKVVAQASILAAHLQTYQRSDMLPPAYHPGYGAADYLWEVKNTIVSQTPAVYSNSLYTAATYMDELRVLYQKQFQERVSNLFTLIDSYPRLTSTARIVISDIFKTYLIRDQSKINTIQTMFAFPAPGPRQLALT